VRRMGNSTRACPSTEKTHDNTSQLEGEEGRQWKTEGNSIHIAPPFFTAIVVILASFVHAKPAIKFRSLGWQHDQAVSIVPLSVMESHL
jgi:hypothetical protein